MKRIIHIGVALFALAFMSNVYAQEKDPSAPFRSASLEKLPDSLKGWDVVELSKLFKTDKEPAMHNFIDVYKRHFDPIRDSVTRVFEIGIFNGASHKMWKCYFDSAEVYGIDIRPKPWVEKLGIHTYIANQANREDLQTFIDSSGGQFDIIIDDGGHRMNHQQVSLGFLFKHLKPGGLFIIEDVHTSIPKFYDGFGVEPSLENTTLTMINNYIMNERIVSEYMLEDEIKYLQLNIEYVELYKRKNSMHSTLCVFKKKK